MTSGGSAFTSSRATSLFCPQGRLYKGRELTTRIYHRFTVDEGNDITAMRLFQDEPKWTPYSRAEGGTDNRESRHEYIKSVAVAA